MMHNICNTLFRVYIELNNKELSQISLCDVLITGAGQEQGPGGIIKAMLTRQ